MGKIRLTEAEERELKAKGVIVKDMENCIQHQRCYYIPAEKKWTKPLPGDGPRMARYLIKGFRLVGPDGELGPPAETRAVAPMKAAQGQPEGAEVEPEAVPAPIVPGTVEEPKTEQSMGVKKRGTLTCPVCGREEEGLPKLMTHMARHETKAQKKKKKGG